MNIKQRKAQILEELSYMEDPKEKMEYLIDKAKNSQGLAQEDKIEENLIKGCQSSLWVKKTFKNEKCFFESDADSVITKAISNLVCQVYSSSTPSDILSENLDFLEALGISSHLSPNRRNGLSNLLNNIFEYAQKANAFNS